MLFPYSVLAAFLALASTLDIATEAKSVSPRSTIPYLVTLWTRGDYHLCEGEIYDQVIIISFAFPISILKMPGTKVKFPQLHVLTTVSCCDSSVDGYVVAGDNDLSMDDGTEQRIDVMEVKEHEGFENYANDICLITLEDELQFNEYNLVIFRARFLGNLKTCSKGWFNLSTCHHKTNSSRLAQLAESAAISALPPLPSAPTPLY